MGKSELDRSSTGGESAEDQYTSSDDSSFYGGDDEQAEYSLRAASFDPALYWKEHQRCIQYIAQSTNYEESKTPKSTQQVKALDTPGAYDEQKVVQHWQRTEAAQDDHELHNPYEGDSTAKQLSESIPAFLKRLPPSTTTVASGPWICIANLRASHDRELYSDIRTLKDSGADLLAEYMSRRRKLEEQNPGKTPGSITRLLKADRTWLEESIVALAKQSRVTCGKWMLFPYPNHVDSTWAKVAEATDNGVLGTAAKVATGDPGAAFEKPTRLICIYTYDFSDFADVKRILLEMLKLKLFSEEHVIYYKCDAYTYLDLMNGNEYKLKASMYNSKDILSENRNGRT